MTRSRDGYDRKHQLQQHWTAATLRALSQQPNIYFRARQCYRQQQPLPYYAPHLRIEADTDFARLRGIGDAVALRLLYSDDRLHQRLLPDEPLQALIFECLEQLRAETRADAAQWPGIPHNLTYNFNHWALQAHQAGLTETAIGLLIFTVLLISRTRLSQQPLPEVLEDPLEATRAGIAPLIGKDLAALKHCCGEQATYARHALNIARTVQQLADSETETQSKGEQEAKARVRTLKQLRLLLNLENGEEQGFAPVNSGESRVFAAGGQQYQVFTREFDRIVMAQSLVRDDLLHELRRQLDTAVHHYGLNRHRLVRLLQQVFALPRRDGWDFGKDSGYLDGRRLTQLIASPDERDIFKQEAFPPHSHAAVTFLLDCSGSMKQYAQPLAVVLEVLSRALEQVGVSCEILGFTTGSWNGGRALKSWYRQGRPAHPGRLNELSQLVFKAADQPWRQARKALPVLLKPDIYRESVDGEAVEWACARLREQEVTRRILTVISDGCPMDTATQNANDEFYLDNHLQQVVQREQQRGQIEIFGVGVGLDLSPYYRRHLAADPETGLDNQWLRELVALWRLHT